MEGARRTVALAELLTYNRAGDGAGDAVEYVAMGDGEDVLYRPVLEGALDPRALHDGTISLGGVMRLNEAIDVRNENNFRRSKAEAEKQRRINAANGAGRRR